MSDDSQIIFQRSLHDKENPYAQINRNLIRDESISPECRWMLIYFLSMRDDFKINAKQLWNHVKKFMGRNKVYLIIEEACQAGYMKREDRIVNNLKRGVTYYISESSQEEFKKCFRRSSFRDTEPRDTENGEALRKTLTSSIEEDDKKNGGKPPTPAPVSSFFSHKRVKISQDKYDSLIKEFGEAKIRQMMDRLDEYADINPKRFRQYACHAAVIRKWIREDEEKKTSNPEKANKQQGFEKDQEFAIKVQKNFTKLPYLCEINVGPTYIEFIYGPMLTNRIKFGDKGFREEVIFNLKKMNLTTDGFDA